MKIFFIRENFLFCRLILSSIGKRAYCGLYYGFIRLVSLLLFRSKCSLFRILQYFIKMLAAY